MTSTKDPPQALSEQVQDRYVEYREMFRSIRRMMVFYAVTLGPGEFLSPRVVKRKLNELQRLQVLLLKAEEALYDQAENAGANGTLDIETLRDQIGRKLDRLRASLDADKVSKGT